MNFKELLINLPQDEEFTAKSIAESVDEPTYLVSSSLRRLHHMGLINGKKESRPCLSKTDSPAIKDGHTGIMFQERVYNTLLGWVISNLEKGF